MKQVLPIFLSPWTQEERGTDGQGLLDEANRATGSDMKPGRVPKS